MNLMALCGVVLVVFTNFAIIRENSVKGKELKPYD